MFNWFKKEQEQYPCYIYIVGMGEIGVLDDYSSVLRKIAENDWIQLEKKNSPILVKVNDITAVYSL